MTFTEAAAHVLRLVGKPLHYKEITDVAIEKDLLSHVGKSPEVTMGARLAAVVKKDAKDNPLMRVKPGVFALQEWDEEAVTTGLADRTPVLERLARMEAKAEKDAPEAVVEEPEVEEPEAEVEEPEDFETEAVPDIYSLPPGDGSIGDDERARAELAASATEIFTAEDDDDEPILGGDESEEIDRGDATGKRRRRRRRRGGRSGVEEDSGLPSYTVSEAPPMLDADEEESDTGRAEGARSEINRSEGSRSEGSRSESNRSEGARSESNRSEGARSEGSRSEGARSEGSRSEARRSDGREGRRSRGREARGASEERPPENPSPESRSGDGRESRTLEGLDAVSVLAFLDQQLSTRSRSALNPLRQLAEQGSRRARNRLDVNDVHDAIVSAVRGEVAQARVERRRPQYRISGKSVVLTEWGMSSEVVRLEKDLAAVVAKHSDAFVKSFAGRLQSLGGQGLTDFISVFLTQIGFAEVRQLKRPGSHNQEMHFSAVARSAMGDVATGIIVRKDGRDVGRERVVELRGALHHYGPAHAGLLLTTGQILSGAKEEAKAENASPVTVIDGLTLARLAAQHGVGVRLMDVRVPQLDTELLDALSAS